MRTATGYVPTASSTSDSPSSGGWGSTSVVSSVRSKGRVCTPFGALRHEHFSQGPRRVHISESLSKFARRREYSTRLWITCGASRTGDAHVTEIHPLDLACSKKHHVF